ncbi:MAG: hypothetical protein IKM61_07130 [Eubacteriaceae bacterium]|nr:hypothetical protein [Eubacteriaceae bacterium]
MKKILSLFLILFVLAAVLPANTFAAESDVEAYLGKCTQLPSSAVFQAKKGKEITLNFRNMPCSEDTNKASEILFSVTYKKDDPRTDFTATAFYINTEDNGWYKTTYNGVECYVFADNTQSSGGYANATTTGMKYPTEHFLGKKFDLEGIISVTGSRLIALEANLVRVENGKSETITTCKEEDSSLLSGGTFNIKGSMLASKFKFEELPEGNYYLNYVIYVNGYYVDKDGHRKIYTADKAILMEDFTVTEHICKFEKTHTTTSWHPHRETEICHGCGEEREIEGTETFTTKTKVIKAATCLQEGKLQELCVRCNSILGTEVIPKENHTPVTVNKTDTYTGDVVCSVCNTLLEKGTDITDHKHRPVHTGEYEDDHPHREIIRCFCGMESYGEEHFETEIINKTDVYTGDEVCVTCGEVVAGGEEIVEKEYASGDVNSDGKVNALDATQILRYANNKSSVLTGCEKGSAMFMTADVNRDGKINALDATQILRYANNKSSVLK